MVKSYFEKRWFNFYKAPKALSISVLGAILSFNCFSQATIKPNIINLTSQETSRSVSKDIPETNSRVSVKDLKRHSIGVGIGQTFLSSELGQNGDDSITLDLYYDYSASYSFGPIKSTHKSQTI